MKPNLRLFTILAIVIALTMSHFAYSQNQKMLVGKENPGLEFFEDWASGSFATNEWSFDPEQANWSMDNYYGNPSPSAMFSWSPALTTLRITSSPLRPATAYSDVGAVRFTSWMSFTSR